MNPIMSGLQGPPIMGLSSKLGTQIATVVVAQDGTGDYNGTTGTPIQDAIDSLPNGGWIFIKPGTYTIGTTLSISTSGITLSGVNGKSILDKDNLTNVLLDITAENTTIEDLVFRSDGVTDMGDAGDLIDLGEAFINIDSCEFNNFHTTGAASCIYTGFLGTHMNITRNKFISVDAPVLLNSGNGYIKLMQNYFEQPSLIPIGLEDTNNSFIAFNSLVCHLSTPNKGINLIDSSRNLITNNYVNAAVNQYVENGTSNYNVFLGNVARTPTVDFTLVGANSVALGNVSPP